MISVNQQKFNPIFCGKRNYDSVNSENGEPKYYNSQTSDFQASDAMTSYGKALLTPHVPSEYELTCMKLMEASDDEVISLEDAVNEVKNFKCKNGKKTDYILACAFENDDSNLIINKKALLTIKAEVLSGAPPAKLEDAIRTCLDEKTMTYDSQKYDTIFDMKGRVRINARLKPRPKNYNSNLRDAKAQRRLLVQNMVEKECPAFNVPNDFKVSSLFVPLSSYRNDLKEEINKIENLPDDLRKTMHNSVEKNDFNLRKVYTDYYSLLNECKTIEDVKELYPHLQIPEKPVWNAPPSKANKLLRERLANCNYDRVAIELLKKGHIDMCPKQDIRVDLVTSGPTNYPSLQRAGFEFDYPSVEVRDLLDKSDRVCSKFLNIPDYSEEEMDNIIIKQAKRTSGFWSDYNNMTRSSWLPIRLIKNKRMYPKNSEYSTDKLVNTYLYQLYKYDKNADYSSNPLEGFNEKEYLTKSMKRRVDSIYLSRYNKEDANIKDMNFIDFASKFDKQAIGETIEGMEDKYTRMFFRSYWNKARKDSLKDAMQIASDLVYEKKLLKEDMTPKIITDKDVDDLINADLDNIPKDNIDAEKLSKYKFMISGIQDKDLKERCLSCISNPDIVDETYFNYMYQIVESSSDDNGLNEDKAIVLIKMHDDYMNEILKDEYESVEEDFVEMKLSKYKSINGEIDYSKVRAEFDEETKYFTNADRLMAQGYDEFNKIIEDKFILNNDLDYKNANKVINMWTSIPERFKGKFVSTLAQNIEESPKTLVSKLSGLHEMVSSWNFDKDDIIIMDANIIPQKVVITSNAKEEMFNGVGENMKLFDSYLTKFRNAATRRTGDKKGQGIKETPYDDKSDAEIKIMGDNGGGFRLFARYANEDDKRKYTTSDGISVKYVFDNFDDHL